MKLYSGPLSLFTAKVRVALAEKAVPYELVSVPFSRAGGYAPKLPEVVAINPEGQVPVLVDGELAIYDSTLILCDAFSVADIGYFLTMTFAMSLGAAPTAELVQVAGWAGRMASRPAVAAELVGLQTAAQAA